MFVPGDRCGQEFAATKVMARDLRLSRNFFSCKGMLDIGNLEKRPNKAVQTEPVTCSFQARFGQEFAAEWGDEPEDGAQSRRSVLDAPLPSLPIAHYDDSPILASRPRAR